MKKKSLATGLAVLENCPEDMINLATQAYTASYQSERSTMMDEERLRLEQDRMAKEEENRRELLRIKRRQVELEQQRLNQQSPPKPY